MDSPQLLHLALLLLALAAPRPNIAMSIVGPAEWIEDYSTEVSVYLCKDCGSCTCKSGANDLKNLKKIADTKNEIFSDVMIELVTNKTHVTVCFEEANSCPEGICSIVWNKPVGSGLSCGILNSGENGRGGVSTEQKTICCEAETDTKKYNPELKCFYTQKSHPKLTSPPADNPKVPTCKTNSTGMWIGILFAVLFVGVCTGWASMYYLRLRGGKIYSKAPSQDRQDSEVENLPLQE